MIEVNHQDAQAVLDIKNLKTYFFLDSGTVRAVDGVDIALERNTTLGLVGESGCGKSVTAMSIMRLIQSPPGRIVEGEILFHHNGGVDIATPLTWGTRRITASGDPATIPALAGRTVLDVAALDGDRVLLLLLDGDEYPIPELDLYDLTVAVLEADGTVTELLSQTLEARPLSIAFWRRHLYLGLNDGTLWRAEGGLVGME